MKPTMHLRVQERKEAMRYPAHVTPGKQPEDMAIQHKTVMIVQQFWEHAGGQEAAGNMFEIVMGSWHDLPLVRA